MLMPVSSALRFTCPAGAETHGQVCDAAATTDDLKDLQQMRVFLGQELSEHG
jgi:hypothetical protein